MSDIIPLLSAVSKVYQQDLQKLDNYIQIICAHEILNSYINNNQIAEINLGYGQILFQIDNDKIAYKFIPSKKFEKLILNTCKTRQSPLLKELSTQINDEFTNIYKELQ